MVLSGERTKIEQEQIPVCFSPVTGKWQQRGMESLLNQDSTDVFADLHKTFIDDESYNSGHGKAYEFYGVDPKEGALAIVRPDQCTSAPLRSVGILIDSRCVNGHCD